MNKTVPRLMLALRALLAIVFINYGLVKLLGGQFYYGDWTMSKSTATGNFLIWAFFGYSPVYGRITGLFELIPGILLLFRRTSFAAAAALFAVSLNITLMDFCFRFTGAAKDMAFVYTILCAVLVAYDARKLRLVLASPQETLAASAAIADYRAARPIDEKGRLRSRIRKPSFVIGVVVVAVFVLFNAHVLGTALGTGPEPTAKAALLERGLKADDLTLVRFRLSIGMLGFNDRAQVDYKVLIPGGSKEIHVNEIRPNGFSAWRVVNVTEGSSAVLVRQ